jgi:hypothetical protein
LVVKHCRSDPGTARRHCLPRDFRKIQLEPQPTAQAAPGPMLPAKSWLPRAVGRVGPSSPALVAMQVELAAEGCRVDSIPRNFGFSFADPDSDRLCVALECFEPASSYVRRCSFVRRQSVRHARGRSRQTIHSGRAVPSGKRALTANGPARLQPARRNEPLLSKYQLSVDQFL